MSLDTIPTLTVTEANVLRRAFPIDLRVTVSLNRFR